MNKCSLEEHLHKNAYEWLARNIARLEELLAEWEADDTDDDSQLEDEPEEDESPDGDSEVPSSPTQSL